MQIFLRNKIVLIKEWYWTLFFIFCFYNSIDTIFLQKEWVNRLEYTNSTPFVYGMFMCVFIYLVVIYFCQGQALRGGGLNLLNIIKAAFKMEILILCIFVCSSRWFTIVLLFLIIGLILSFCSIFINFKNEKV